MVHISAALFLIVVFPGYRTKRATIGGMWKSVESRHRYVEKFHTQAHHSIP